MCVALDLTHVIVLLELVGALVVVLSPCGCYDAHEESLC
jgi:hypothetical protein